MSVGYHKDFKESMRDAVCKGELCPECLGTNVKCVGSAPDGINMNYAYDCKNPECKAQWEGY